MDGARRALQEFSLLDGKCCVPGCLQGFKDRQTLNEELLKIQ